MAEHPIQGLMGVTIEKIRDMVNSETIIGDPIHVDDTTIIPVSRVTFGFASGGSDVAPQSSKQMFGGGSGAGVTIQPVAFLTVYQGEVRLVSVDNNGSTAEGIVGMIPDVLQKVKGMFSKKKDADDFSEITQDDIDMV